MWDLDTLKKRNSPTGVKQLVKYAKALNNGGRLVVERKRKNNESRRKKNNKCS